MARVSIKKIGDELGIGMRQVGTVRRTVNSTFGSRKLISDAEVKCEITPARIYCSGNVYARATGKKISRGGGNYSCRVYPDTLKIEIR